MRGRARADLGGRDEQPSRGKGCADMPVFSSHLVTYPDLGLGKRIREVRQRQGLTLQDLAARCGVSAARLSQIENEEHVLDVGQAFAIADGLQIPLESLLPADVRIPYQITREERVHCRP